MTDATTSTKIFFYAYGDLPSSLRFGYTRGRDGVPVVMVGVWVDDDPDGVLVPESRPVRLGAGDLKLGRDRTYTEMVEKFGWEETADIKGALLFEEEFEDVKDGMAFLKARMIDLAGRFDGLLVTGQVDSDGYNHHLDIGRFGAKGRRGGRWASRSMASWKSPLPNTALATLAHWEDVERFVSDSFLSKEQLAGLVERDLEPARVACREVTASVAENIKILKSGGCPTPVYLPHVVLRAASHSRDQDLLLSIFHSGSSRLAMKVLKNVYLSQETHSSLSAVLADSLDGGGPFGTLRTATSAEYQEQWPLHPKFSWAWHRLFWLALSNEKWWPKDLAKVLDAREDVPSSAVIKALLRAPGAIADGGGEIAAASKRLQVREAAAKLIV